MANIFKIGGSPKSGGSNVTINGVEYSGETLSLVEGNGVWCTSTPNLIFPSFEASLQLDSNGDIQCIGRKYPANGDISDWYHYKLSNSTWSSVSTVPYYCGGNIAMVIDKDGCIHMMSGNSNTDKHYKYDGTTWSSVSTLPVTGAFFKQAILDVDKNINIFGYTNTNETMYHYKYVDGTWVSASTIPYTYYGSNNPIVTKDGSIVVISNSKEVFSYSNGTWTCLCSTLPVSYMTSSKSVYKDETIYYIGGGASTCNCWYTFVNNEFVYMGETPSATYESCIVDKDNKILLFYTTSAKSYKLEKSYKMEDN